jgi:hypothetical protein
MIELNMTIAHCFMNKNQMRLVFVTFLFIATSTVAKSNPIDTVRFSLTTIMLNDGSLIYGMLEYQTTDSVAVHDFNLGRIAISAKEIKELDIKALEGKVVIESVNGKILIGELIGLNSGLIFLKSSSAGVICFPANLISRITPYALFASRKGSIWFANPNATRYFFAPSAIPLKKKEGYFQNAYIIGNSVNVGITDNITIGGGVVIPFLFYITPKISYKLTERFYAGAGVLFTQSFISDMGLSAGIAYGLATYGTPEHNMTLGAGYGFASFDNKYSATPGPIATVNGMTRVSKKISLVTENWMIPRAGYNKEVLIKSETGSEWIETLYEKKNFYSVALSFGLRFMPNNAISIDFSVVNIAPDPDTKNVTLPYLDFVYKF